MSDPENKPARKRMRIARYMPYLLPAAVVIYTIALVVIDLLYFQDSTEPPPPNIVLILADDLGYKDVGYNGAVVNKTPNIDRLAQEGVIFSNGYVTHPFCGPSRAGLITGRYQARFGMDENLAYAPFDPQHGLPVKEKTFAAQLKEAGYRTALVGKWHLGAAEPFHPLNRGFDFFYGFLGGGHDYFRINAVRSLEALLPLSENMGAAGFEGYLTDALTDRALDFIGEEQDSPFFLFLSYSAPHVPLQAPEELIEKYAHVESEDRRVYAAMVDSLDWNVGRVLKALERAGKRDNTLVFFLSDNGGVYPWSAELEHYTWADNAPLRAGKTSMFEGGIRVPFAASWPARWPRGEIYEQPVISLDIAATALALAETEADPERPLDGVNLDPFLRGEAAGSPHEALFWRRRGGRSDSYAVRAGDAKLVRADARGEASLFDLRSDIGETRDRIREDADTAARLAGIWNEWSRQNTLGQVAGQGTYERSLKQWRNGMVEETWRDALARPRFQIELAAGAPSE